MKTFLRFAAVLSLLAAASIVLTLKSSGPATEARQQTPQDQKREKIQRLKFQTFRGEAAALRANQLRAKSKAVNRAMKDAEKRGKHPAFNQGIVVLGTDPEKASSPVAASSGPERPSRYRRASFAPGTPQDFWSDGYEISVMPYDSPSTIWEGIIYRNGPDIDEDTAYAVIDITGDEPSVIQDSYYPPDGGDPNPLLLLARRSNPNTNACSQMVPFQTVRTSLTKDVFKWTGRPECPPGTHRCIGKEATGCCGPIPRIDPWAKGTSLRAIAAGAACAISGAAWLGCTVGASVGGAILCLT